MPRHPRLFLPGATDHAYCRVARGEFVFDDEVEATEFTTHAVGRCGLRVCGVAALFRNLRTRSRSLVAGGSGSKTTIPGSRSGSMNSTLRSHAEAKKPTNVEMCTWYPSISRNRGWGDSGSGIGRFTASALNQVSAPPHDEPAPAVQPKQWRAVTIRRRAS